jgi:hypothetical protein
MMKSGQAVASLTAHDGDRGMLLFMRENVVSATWQSGGGGGCYPVASLWFDFLARGGATVSLLISADLWDKLGL